MGLSAMPREPRCDRNGLNARKGDEAVPVDDGTARSPDAADAHSCRNPKGRRIFRPMPALLGLDGPSLGPSSPSRLGLSQNLRRRGHGAF